MLQTTEIFGKITTSQFNKNVPDPLLILQRKREYIIIHRTFNFDNPDKISALINVMFCIPRVLMRIRDFVQNGRHQQTINTVQDQRRVHKKAVKL